MPSFKPLAMRLSNQVKIRSQCLLTVPATSLIGSRRERLREKRPESFSFVPRRQLILRHAQAGRSRASSSTLTGLFASSRAGGTGRRPYPRTLAWLADVLARIAGHPASRLDGLLPYAASAKTASRPSPSTASNALNRSLPTNVLSARPHSQEKPSSACAAHLMPTPPTGAREAQAHPAHNNAKSEDGPGRGTTHARV